MDAEPTREPRAADFFGARTEIGLAVLVADWAAIAALVAVGVWLDARAHGILVARIGVYLATIWLIGAVQFAIGETLLHDASHNHLFKKRSWNDGFALVIGDPFLIDLRVYRGTHLWHHRDLLGSHDYIPMLYSTSGLLRPGANPLWLVFFRPIVMPAFATAYYLLGLISPRPRMLFIWGMAIAVCWYFGAIGIFLKYWVVPLLWCFPTFVYWSETADHLYVTGSRSRVGWLSNLVFNNNGYHALHHRYPAIPWFRLPRAARILKFQEGEVARSFVDTQRLMMKGSDGLPGTAPPGVTHTELSLPRALLRMRRA